MRETSAMPHNQKSLKPDPVLKELAAKKLELLRRLLVRSQYFATTTQDSEHDRRLGDRTALFQDLQKTDDCIAQRENMTGVSVHLQERTVFNEIQYLLQAIYSNNSLSLRHLEAKSQSLKREKSQLEKSKKLSGYVYQQSG